MTDIDDKTAEAHAHLVDVLVDRHAVKVPKGTTVGGVLSAAHLDPAQRRLVLVKGKHQTPFPDPSTPLKVHEGEVFVTISTGPTPGELIVSAAQLRDALLSVGFDPVVETDPTGGWVTFDYTVEVGAHAGETVRIGLLGADWPINAPGAVQVRPRIPAPLDGNLLQSPLGPDWVYWSRPYPDWVASSRTLDDYLAHLRLLFSQHTAAA